MNGNEKLEKFICNDNVLPDSEILAWEKWIQIRKEEIDHLAKKTGRPPVDLVMNKLEKVREIKERKTVLENAQIEKKCTIRNGIVWEDPARLSQMCSCQSTYEAQRTKAELGNPRFIERVGVPKIIQENEKGLTGFSKKKPFLKLDAEYVKYKKRREKELQNKIKKLDPYRPEVDNLIVMGTKLGLDKKDNFSVPVLKLETAIPPVFCEESVYAVQINESIYYKCFQGIGLEHLKEIQQASSPNQSSWTYYFNSPINKMARAKLFLKNLGTITLRYCWKKIIKPIEFIPQTVNEPVFFFNKNDDVIHPGQEKNISITFLSKRPNFYQEKWEIKFHNISFLDTKDDIFEINFVADVAEHLDAIKRKANKLRNAIGVKATKTMIKLLVEGIVTEVTNIDYQIYPYKDLLLEAEMFEMKNPEYFYHESKVTILKQLHVDISPSKWQLSIKYWRQEIMKLEYDERVKYYELLKQLHRELLKPSRKDENILHNKYKAVKVVLCRFFDKFHAQYLDLLKEYDNSEIGTILEESTNYPYLRKQNMCVDSKGSVHYTFYLQMYSHMCSAIETCAGIISGIDLNRWISFDFCPK